jgi:hypothetical protein
MTSARSIQNRWNVTPLGVRFCHKSQIHRTMMKDASTARDLELQAEGAASFPAPEEVRASHTSRVKPDEATKAKKGRSLVLVSWVVLVVLAIAVPSIIIGRKSTSSHVGVVSKYFVDQGVSESSAFDDESSPQYLAALWLASQDGAKLPLPSDTRGVREYLFRYVMALNYFAFDGDKWFAPLKFLSNEPVCKWKSLDFGVLCYEVDGEELPLELVLSKYLVP